jgi:hypothetical protein
MADPLTRAIYQAVVGNTSIRYLAYPAPATALVAVADDSAWDQIVDSTVITVEHWLAMINFASISMTADLEERLTEGIGGADGAAIAAATNLVEAIICGYFTSDGVGFDAQFMTPYVLPIPIRVAASTRHAVEITESLVGGQALTVGITDITGLGT